MADESPPGSPLSVLSSDAFEAEEEHERLAAMPPAKRQKLGNSLRGTPVPLQDDDNDAYVSSDTDGDIPTPPSHLRVDDDDIHEQITKCNWEGCQMVLPDTDKLVTHINNEHIEGRSKKYTCEWMNCGRKGQTHASGYALKSHMRSHTREKPFFCLLPECDRAFTRSDALAKHMRTVHDTEPLRPSDPIPKANFKHRIKITSKDSPAPSDGHGSSNGVANGSDTPVWTSSFPSELGFTAEEEARGLEQLYELLRRQVHWAEEEGVLLKQQCDAMEEVRKQEWLEKEVLLEQVISTDSSYNAIRQQVTAGRLAGPDGAHIIPKVPQYAIPEIQAAANKSRLELLEDPNINSRRWFRNYPETVGPTQLPAPFRTPEFVASLRGADAGKYGIGVLNSLPAEDRMDFMNYNIDTGAAANPLVALVLAAMKREWQGWDGSQ